MLELLGILAAIALLDSLSMVPIAVVPLANALGGRRRLLTAGAFIGGIFVAYFLFGLLLVGGMDLVFEHLGDYFSRLWNHPNSLELAVQILIGLLLMVSAWYLWRLRPKKEESSTIPTLRPGAMFSLGVTLIALGIPGAVPYLAASERIVQYDPGWFAAVGYLIFYNVLFIAPILVLVGLFIALPNKSEKLCTWITRITATYLPKIGAVLFFIVGLVMIADGIGWFLGHPLLPVQNEPH